MRLFFILLIPFSASATSLDNGLHALQAADYPAAAQELRVAVAERPGDAIAHFNYASALRELGQYEDALGEYQAAVREARDPVVRSDALYGIALVRNQQGDPTRAAEAWRGYLSFAENRPADASAVEIARVNLAAAEREQGMRKASR